MLLIIEEVLFYKGINMKYERNYKYIPISDGVYINTNSNCIDLFLTLYKRAKVLSFLERRSGSKLINNLPFVLRAIRTFKFTKEFIKKKKTYLKSESQSSISVNFNGQCLIVLRMGEYKIFNFKNKEVITFFDDNFPIPIIEDRIRIVSEAEECDLAPRLIKKNPSERYFTEEYINYKKASFNIYEVNKRPGEIITLLKTIISAKEVQLFNLSNYIEYQLINVNLFLHRANENDKIMFNKIKRVNDFTSILESVLRNVNDTEGIMLVNSHGDFWEGNILKEKNKTRIIDWSTLGIRSCHFDYYYMLFMLANKDSHFDKVSEQGLLNLSENWKRIEQLFYMDIVNNLDSSTCKLPPSYSSEVNRYLFYLELLFLKSSRVDIPKAKHINEMNTWVKRFIILEKYLKFMDGEKQYKV